MNSIRISEAANLAVHALAFMAANPDTSRSTGEIAKQLKVSTAHLAKVMQRLSRAKVLSSARGPKGGFTFARDPKSLSVLEVLEIIEGPHSKEACLLGRSLCQPGNCMFKDLSSMVRKELSDRKISDFRWKGR